MTVNLNGYHDGDAVEVEMTVHLDVYTAQNASTTLYMQMKDICKDTSFSSPFAHFNEYEEFNVDYTLGQGLLEVPLSAIAEATGLCDDIQVDISVWEGGKVFYAEIPVYTAPVSEVDSPTSNSDNSTESSVPVVNDFAYDQVHNTLLINAEENRMIGFFDIKFDVHFPNAPDYTTM